MENWSHAKIIQNSNKKQWTTHGLKLLATGAAQGPKVGRLSLDIHQSLFNGLHVVLHREHICFDWDIYINRYA
jgi:hypothetical protein